MDERYLIERVITVIEKNTEAMNAMARAVEKNSDTSILASRATSEMTELVRKQGEAIVKLQEITFEARNIFKTKWFKFTFVVLLLLFLLLGGKFLLEQMADLLPKLTLSYD